MPNIIEQSCTQIPKIDFEKIFKNYQHIWPGLNYSIACDNPPCEGYNDLIILHRGLGEFDLGDRIHCPICLEFLDRKSIKSLIFFKANTSIDFELTDGYRKIISLSARGNRLLLFGDRTERAMYSKLRINVID